MKELLHTSAFDGFPLDLHQAMVGDARRMEAFDAALRAVIRPGDTVVDIGAGTGILSLCAWRAGAGRVIAIERSEIIESARSMLKSTYPAAPIEFLRIDVEREALPDVKADVIVCELLGNLGPEERLVPVLQRVRREMLREGGRVIPEELRLMAAPVECHEVFKDLTSWRHPAADFDLSAFQSLAWARPYHVQKEPVCLLGDPAAYAELDLRVCDSMPATMACELQLREAGTLHGILCWFEARLAPGVILSTSPAAPASHWGQVFFPLGEERPVQAGSCIDFELVLAGDEFELEWTWRGRVREQGAQTTTFDFTAHGTT